MPLGCRVDMTLLGTNSEHGSVLLYVRRNRLSVGRGARDGHLDSHTAPELCGVGSADINFNTPSTAERQWPGAVYGWPFMLWH